MKSSTTITMQILPRSDIFSIIPLLQKLGNYAVFEDILKERLREMVGQNYECLGVFDHEKLIGVCGLWFQTRHYAGRCIEVEHVFIEEEYQNQGLGKKLMEYVYDYAAQESCNWIELNAYVHNFGAHKFYYNEGFVAKGYHFVKVLT